jgi:SWI/SNF-related matrix-associated actin-dependent regulator of chromatin subfamily A3
VQNKLDDVFALIKFLRLSPLDDKSVWTEYIGSPVKFNQALGVQRLQLVMKAITLRRTKESKADDGSNILNLPPRKDELRFLKFGEHEKAIYDGFFQESKAEFRSLKKEDVMKNYVGILQKILRLRQICDSVELVQGKGGFGRTIEDVMKSIEEEGLTTTLAAMMFTFLKEGGTSQCVECSCELGPSDGDVMGDGDCTQPNPPAAKKARKSKALNGLQTPNGTGSNAGTRQNSPDVFRPILTKCQHLFCIECFKQHVCPCWPAFPGEGQVTCAACQSIIATSKDAVEISPESLNEIAAYMNAQNEEPRKKAKREKGQRVFSNEPMEQPSSLSSIKIQSLIHDLLESSKLNPHSHNYDPDVMITDAEGNQDDDSIVKTVVL